MYCLQVTPKGPSIVIARFTEEFAAIRVVIWVIYRGQSALPPVYDLLMQLSFLLPVTLGSACVCRLRREWVTGNWNRTGKMSLPVVF